MSKLYITMNQRRDTQKGEIYEKESETLSHG